MSISAKILLDSVNPVGNRLTTWELRYPRFIHSEFMTHRDFSRNAASSRAIPIEKMLKAVMEDPAMPEWWGKNQRGMQANEELPDDDAGAIFGAISGYYLSSRRRAEYAWLEARDEAIKFVELLSKIGLHKQVANRIIEPWSHITVISSATEHANFFKLRAHKDAQPEFQRLAYLMRDLYHESRPQELDGGDRHLPLIEEKDISEAWRRCESSSSFLEFPGEFIDELLTKVSVGRCARVSYLTHDGKRDLDEDVALHDRLKMSGHWSPFEHAATSWPEPTRFGNFVGFKQYRKYFAEEYVPSMVWIGEEEIS